LRGTLPVIWTFWENIKPHCSGVIRKARSRLVDSVRAPSPMGKFNSDSWGHVKCGVSGAVVEALRIDGESKNKFDFYLVYRVLLYWNEIWVSRVSSLNCANRTAVLYSLPLSKHMRTCQGKRCVCKGSAKEMRERKRLSLCLAHDICGSLCCRSRLKVCRYFSFQPYRRESWVGLSSLLALDHPLSCTSALSILDCQNTVAHTNMLHYTWREVHVSSLSHGVSGRTVSTST
jgi:hypothetical protein